MMMTNYDLSILLAAATMIGGIILIVIMFLMFRKNESNK